MRYRIIATILLLLALGAGYLLLGGDTNQSSLPSHAVPGPKAPAFHTK